MCVLCEQVLGVVLVGGLNGVREKTPPRSLVLTFREWKCFSDQREKSLPLVQHLLL